MEALTAEAFTLLGVGICVVLLRTAVRARQLGIRHLQADDYFMLAALLPYAAGTACVYAFGAIGKGFANSSMTDAQRAALDPDSEEYRLRIIGSKIQVGGWCLYSILLWLIKTSLCAFYLRLTAGLEGFDKLVKMGFVLLAVTFIALVTSLLLSCRPFHRFWQIHPNPGLTCQPILSRVYLFMTLSLNLTTDLYLLLIPVPLLWKARMPTRKKLGLTVLFSGGLFVITAAVLRCILTLKNPITGPTIGASWAVREGFVAIVTSNMPMIWTWARREFGTASSSLLPSSGSGGRVDNIIMLGVREKASLCQRLWKKSKRRGTKVKTTSSGPAGLQSFNYQDTRGGNSRAVDNEEGFVPPIGMREDIDLQQLPDIGPPVPPKD
ncbi:hypothetical protein F5X68DRAFT_244936 [Plectosphaerella plurivora]|uniref:Rhodopsin domain-containing protein n=1 Tax=Plectosphaerella plurivora TaxID=936078 RepID=A0A9P8V6B9_9PEZI|nr:hypothetical protein F5X68DRAFT_244936 [Plectosphaerella plurivora]